MLKVILLLFFIFKSIEHYVDMIRHEDFPEILSIIK